MGIEDKPEGTSEKENVGKLTDGMISSKIFWQLPNMSFLELKKQESDDNYSLCILKLLNGTSVTGARDWCIIFGNDDWVTEISKDLILERGVYPTGHNTYEILRMESGHPRMGVDIQAGMLTPVH